MFTKGTPRVQQGFNKGVTMAGNRPNKGLTRVNTGGLKECNSGLTGAEHGETLV